MDFKSKYKKYKSKYLQLVGGSRFTLSSPHFENGGIIPIEYTCDGKGIIPELIWLYPPIGTKTFALIIEDPDAPRGIFVHWFIWNVSSDSNRLSGKYVTGNNSANMKNYYPMCPPSGVHRYYFTLYALDTVLDIDEYVSVSEFREIIDKHILGKAVLVGRYGK